jgi:hypothetical protein
MLNTMIRRRSHINATVSNLVSEDLTVTARLSTVTKLGISLAMLAGGRHPFMRFPFFN